VATSRGALRNVHRGTRRNFVRDLARRLVGRRGHRGEGVVHELLRNFTRDALGDFDDLLTRHRSGAGGYGLYSGARNGFRRSRPFAQLRKDHIRASAMGFVETARLGPRPVVEVCL
jgi:hypothetical protein